MIATMAVVAIPHLRPYLSGTYALKGMATTHPRNTIATLREVVAVVSLKYSAYEGNICKPFIMDES